jgi:hypothetical protein
MTPIQTAIVAFKGLFTLSLFLGESGHRYVVVAQIAEALGLARQPLLRRVHRQFPKGGTIMVHPSSGGPQEVLAVDLKYLPAILAGIEVSRCREEIRPRLAEIQDELYEALAAYVFEGQALNPAFAAPETPVAAPAALPAPAPLLPLVEALLAQLSRDCDGLVVVRSLLGGPIPAATIEPARETLRVADRFLKRAADQEAPEAVSAARERYTRLAARLAAIPAEDPAGLPMAPSLATIEDLSERLRSVCFDVLHREPAGSKLAAIADYCSKLVRVARIADARGLVN